MNKADAYQKACDIADVLLSRGFPVIQYEAVDDEIIIRFGGPEPQQIHASAAGASVEGYEAAYRGYARDPAWSRR